jgi:ABC-2 type transport system permease protein/oleandomycin transport system permease protein
MSAPANVMTSDAVASPARVDERAHETLAPTAGGFSLAIADWMTMTWRNLLGYIRIPDAMFFSSVQPIMFVLLFRYVFGGAINVPGGRYVDFLIAGIFVQTVAFGGIGTAIGLADDMSKGVLERLRTLPMARFAVLAGRTTADLCRNVFVIGLITAIGYAVGFRVHTNVLLYFAAVAVLLMFAFSVAWGFATIGLRAPNGEVAQLMAFPILMPMTFASSAFVPVQTMPGWLQAFARNQPVTAAVDATRALLLGGPTTDVVLKSIAWSLALLAVFAFIAIRKFRNL